MARGGVFVSYRRSDALSAAHHVHSELARVLRDLDGDDQRKVFLDIDAIQPGEDFRDVINDTLQLCIAVLVVIGPRWLSTADSRGRRRLDSPSDTHALEISTALAAGNLVIPVLVEGAEMPSSDELPASLVELSFRNAFEVGVGRRFTTDIAELASRVVEAEEVAAAEQRARERREAEEVVAAEQRARERREAEEVVAAEQDGLVANDDDQASQLAGLTTGIQQVSDARAEEVAAHTSEESDGTNHAHEGVGRAERLGDDESQVLVADVVPAEEETSRSTSSPEEACRGQTSQDERDQTNRRSIPWRLMVAVLAAAVILVFAAVRLPTRGDEDSSTGAQADNRQALSASETIAVGGRPNAPLLAGGRVWVPVGGDHDGENLTAIDADTYETTDTVEEASLPVPGDGRIWALDLSGSFPRSQGVVKVIDVESSETIDSTSNFEFVPSWARPVAEAEGKVWIPVSGLSIDEGALVVRDAESLDQIASIGLGGSPVGPPVSSDGKLYVLHNDSGIATLTVIDLISNEEVGSISLRSQTAQRASAPAAGEGKVWAAVGQHSLVVVDAKTDEIVATLDVGEWPSTPAIANGKAWVPIEQPGSVAVVDARTNELITTVEVGALPSRPAVGDDNGKIWVANVESASVTVIDAHSNEVIDTVEVGDSPTTPAVVDGNIWVANRGSNSITVIDGATHRVLSRADSQISTGG